MERPIRRWAISASAALALFALGSVPSTAMAGWRVAQLDDGGVTSALFGVSCASPSLCVAVGSNSVVASSTDPGGGASAWRIVHPEGAFDGSGVPGGGGVRYMGNAIRAVSCPSENLCVAAGPQGHFISSTDPTGGVGAWKLVDRGLEASHMNGISCPDAELCVAVGYNGKIVTSTDPTGDAPAWAITKLARPFDLRGVSCASRSLCVAVDNEGNILASTNPTGGTSTWSLAEAPAGPSNLNAVACPSTALCVSANAGQILTSTSPASPASWRAVLAGSGLPVTGIACPSASACAAVDNNADAIVSTEPLGGAAAWSYANLIPSPPAPDAGPNGLFAVSCPTSSLCVAVGQEDQLAVSTDPFPPTSGEASGSPGSKGAGKRGAFHRSHSRHRHRLRPDVRITWHPQKRVAPHRHGVRVTFRFRALGRVRGFVCRLDRRRLSRCRPPRHYRVGRGKHVFRVAAIGRTGRRGHLATFRFRVGALRESPPVGSCPQTGPSDGPCVNPR